MAVTFKNTNHSFIVELKANDYITLQGYQGSSGDREIRTAKTFLQVRKIS